MSERIDMLEERIEFVADRCAESHSAVGKISAACYALGELTAVYDSLAGVANKYVNFGTDKMSDDAAAVVKATNGLGDIIRNLAKTLLREGTES